MVDHDSFHKIYKKKKKTLAITISDINLKLELRCSQQFSRIVQPDKNLYPHWVDQTRSMTNTGTGTVYSFSN